MAVTSRLTWLLLIRVLTATVLFGATIALQIREGDPSTTTKMLYMLIVSMYGFSALMGLLQYQVKRLVSFALFQLFADTVFVTILIYLTGGAESIFSFVYFINIIAGAYTLFAPGAFSTATASGLAYAGLMFGIWRGIFPPFHENIGSSPDWDVLFYNVLVNVFAFYLLAFLANYLTSQLREAGAALRIGQDQLRNMESLKNRIVENIEAGVLTVSPEGRITSFNRALRSILGLSSHQLFQRPLAEVLPEGLTTELLTAAGGGAPLVKGWEFPFKNKGGQRLILGVSSSPLRQEDGEAIGTILIVEDRTELRTMERQVKQEERLATIGRLAAGIAHEIRNPLASISGSIQILQLSIQPEGSDARLMNIVLRETERLNGLITDFLQYVGQAPVNKGPVKLDELIQDVSGAAGRDPKMQGRVQHTLTLNHSREVMGEPNQLRQVLWNLILNAADAVGEDGHVWIETRDLDGVPTPKQSGVELKISDNGEGIPEDILTKIFDPFFSTKTKGTGLGLAMVERIIQNHEGVIFAQARQGGGAEFVIHLPGLMKDPPQLGTEDNEGGAKGE